MAAVTNGHVNGVNGHANRTTFDRFSEVPQVIDIPVQQDENEAVQIDLSQLEDDIEELCALLETEHAARNYWITIALAYVKINKADLAVDLLKRALEAIQGGRPEDRLSILMCLCWLFLWRCRRAPRVKPAQGNEDERTKDYWLTQATSTVNDASKINPSYSPLFLARGSLGLLRASLQPQAERNEILRQASKNFDEAYRSSGNKNLMAILGKAKTQFSMGKYPEAYVLYQQVLERAPDMTDPDPRIGIGCCLWQLGHKDNAKEAWERSLQLNPKSKIANILLGLFFLNDSSRYNSGDPEFADLYRKAMTTYTQTAFKLDDMHALTCSTFGGYFLLRKTWANVERLARRAIEHTDVNAIASDGWYLLARKDHYEGDLAKAQDHYGKADQARGGDEKGFLPAKFGVAQLKTLMQDYDGAKFRLEKMIATNKSVEAMTLLGILHAEDVFAAQASGSKEDKSAERKKAIALLESVRVAWKDSQRKIQPDPAILLNLARLYESDQADKSLQCLQQVEQMEIDEIPEDDIELPADVDLEDESIANAALHAARQQMLSPQLLNNIGCFLFQADRLGDAREYFYAALQSSAKIAARDKSVDTDALVSSISYNYARTWEAENQEDRAKEVYDSLLERHPHYIDAKTRLAYMAIQKDRKQGTEEVRLLMEADPNNLELRSLYGWCLHRSKKRTLQLSEDQEQRHFKHTLQTFDKHDVYALTAMGNLNLTVAREMRRDTDQDKDRRSKTYMRAVEFFDKVLTLDPKNAFAAQGMAIALVEDKKDTSTAIQIFAKLKETIKDATVFINLGHVFCEMKQYGRSIDSYENALRKLHEKSPPILACLGRVFLMRGRAEKLIEYYQKSLEYSREALALDTDNIAYKFNVAFVQIQIAQQMISQPEVNKTVNDMQTAAQDLDDAIESFIAIARSPQAPFPKNDIEQRANMGRNTMKRQLATALEKQQEWENKNAVRLQEARKRQEEVLAKREEQKRILAEQEEEKKRKLREERERITEADRQLISRRLEEEKAREAAEYTTDAETGERKKREKKPKEKRQKRKKKGEDSDTDPDALADGTGDEGGKRSRPRSRLASQTASDGEAPRRTKKKRRLERKGAAGSKSSKYKSAETIEDSDEDDDAGLQPASRSDDRETPAESTPAPADDSMADGGDEEEEEAAVSRPSQRKKPARIVDDDDEDEDEAPATNGGDTSMADDVPAAGDSDHGGD